MSVFYVLIPPISCAVAQNRHLVVYSAWEQNQQFLWAAGEIPPVLGAGDTNPACHLHPCSISHPFPCFLTQSRGVAVESQNVFRFEKIFEASESPPSIQWGDTWGHPHSPFFPQPPAFPGTPRVEGPTSGSALLSYEDPQSCASKA